MRRRQLTRGKIDYVDSDPAREAYKALYSARECLKLSHLEAAVITPKRIYPLPKGFCMNCGKIFPRGLHLHQRSCK